MKAISTQTGRTYDTWDDLVAAEAAGYAVVVMMQRPSQRSGRTQSYSRVTGPFPDKRKAMNKAVAVRKEFKRWVHRDPQVRLLGVSVQPIWTDLSFD